MALAPECSKNPAQAHIYQQWDGCSLLGMAGNFLGWAPRHMRETILRGGPSFLPCVFFCWNQIDCFISLSTLFTMCTDLKSCLDRWTTNGLKTINAEKTRETSIYKITASDLVLMYTTTSGYNGRSSRPRRRALGWPSPGRPDRARSCWSRGCSGTPGLAPWDPPTSGWCPSIAPGKVCKVCYRFILTWLLATEDFFSNPADPRWIT